jgi:spore cortex formation protein SpoVR/YcgB (stage V sporulation)
MDCLENIIDSVILEILLVMEPNIMMRNVISHKDFWGNNTLFRIFMAHSDTSRLSYAILDLIKEELIFDIEIS